MINTQLIFLKKSLKPAFRSVETLQYPNVKIYSISVDISLILFLWEWI